MGPQAPTAPRRAHPRGIRRRGREHVSRHHDDAHMPDEGRRETDVHTAHCVHTGRGRVRRACLVRGRVCAGMQAAGGPRARGRLRIAIHVRT
eukprot:167853-Prymnesium_polylepis.1